MDEVNKTPVQDLSKSNTTDINPNPLKQPEIQNPNNHSSKKTKILLVSIIGIILFIVAAATIFSITNYTKTPEVEKNKIITNESNNDYPKDKLTPTNSPTSNPSFVLYSKLPKSENKNLTNFSEPLLKINFSYPSKYFVNTLPADNKDMYATAYFLSERDIKKEESIQNVIDCHLENRIDPAGLCIEGIAGDIQVDLSINEDVSETTDYMEDQSWKNECVKEELAKDKVLYSCVTLLAPSPDAIGMNYALYLTGKNSTVINIQTYRPKEYSDLITNIIDSAKTD